MENFGYDSDINFLKNDTLIDEFLLYYNLRYEQAKDADPLLDKDRLIKLIDTHLRPVPVFSYPKLIKINKMGSLKQRTVFIFPTEEMKLLKYLNFAINSLELPIHPNCYSFQRGKHIAEAINSLRKKGNFRLSCIKIDIKDYFNSIDISDIDSWLPAEIHQHVYIKSIIIYLLQRDEVLIDGKTAHYPKRGVMAGMPLAPTLSNLYLRSFDVLMSENFAAYTRYSDDMLIFCETDSVEEAYQFIKNELKYRGLEINEKKTQTYSPYMGYEFLGLYINSNGVDLSEATIARMKGKISRHARSLYRWRIKNSVNSQKAAAVMNRKFNRKFFGDGAEETDFTWSKYFFGVITVDKGLKIIDRYYQEAIRTLETGKHAKINYKTFPYKLLKEAGYRPLVSEWYRWYKKPHKE